MIASRLRKSRAEYRDKKLEGSPSGHSATIDTYQKENINMASHITAENPTIGKTVKGKVDKKKKIFALKERTSRKRPRNQ